MKNFFKGISVTQVSAGALAAVTSFLLSAKIGIAGSVIGVAIGSVISAVASQIYQNVLKESSKKLQTAAPFVDQGDEDEANGEQTTVIGTSGQSAKSDHGNASGSTTMIFAGEGSDSLSALARGRTGAEQDAQQTMVGSSYAAQDETKGDATQLIGTADGADATRVMPAAGSAAASRTASSRGTGVSPTNGEHGVLSASKQREVQQRNKRVAIIIAVVAALIGVAVTAGVITLLTQGEGTDHVVRDIVNNSSTRTPDSDSDGKTPSTDSNDGDGKSGSSDGQNKTETPKRDGNADGHQQNGTQGNTGSSSGEGQSGQSNHSGSENGTIGGNESGNTGGSGSSNSHGSTGGNGNSSGSNGTSTPTNPGDAASGGASSGNGANSGPNAGGSSSGDGQGENSSSNPSNGQQGGVSSNKPGTVQ